MMLDWTAIRLPILAGFTFSAMLAAPLVARAGDDWQVSPVFGTLGAGVEARWQPDPFWAIRAGVQGGLFDLKEKLKRGDFQNRVTLLNSPLVIDWYPTGGNFRLSGGVVLSANSFKGHVYNIKDHVRAFGRRSVVEIADPLTRYDVTFNPIQPYLGAGYTLASNDKASLDVNLGVVYTGSPRLDVVSRAGRLGFTKAEINREIRKANRIADNYMVQPVVGLRLNFKF